MKLRPPHERRAEPFGPGWPGGIGHHHTGPAAEHRPQHQRHGSIAPLQEVERTDLEKNNNYHGEGTERADGAVFHDFQTTLSLTATKETVRAVRQAIEMKPAAEPG